MSALALLLLGALPAAAAAPVGDAEALAALDDLRAPPEARRLGAASLADNGTMDDVPHSL